ncbi:MAG: NAD(P)H-dependent oxidoreductase [Deltaproteobacteria bacterium]|nr:NAD(P)H-dependent oxidoreductase [Deltaproteobacteria bacterium]
MTFIPKILAFAGSTRTGSWNKKLIRIAVASAKAAGGDVTLIDLRDFPLPLYDGDLESDQGLPANAMKLKDLFLAHHGFLISAPEYNSSITGVLKNVIDWVSRPAPNEVDLICFTNKFAGLMSASPGGLGGLRGLVTLRSILGNIGTHVLPLQQAISKAHEAFNEDGTLKDSKQQKAVDKIAAGLVHIVQKFHS